MKPLPVRPAKRQTQQQQSAHSDTLSAMDQRVEHPRWRFKHFTSIACALGILTISAFAYSAFGLTSSTTLSLDRVEVHPAIWSDFKEIVLVNGRMIPDRTVYLDSVEGGRVVAVHAEEGEAVTAGTALVTLQNTNLELQVMGREAQYTEQLSNLALSQIEFDRTGLQYEQQLADAQLQIELAQAELARYKDPQMTGIPRSVIEQLETELAHYHRGYALIESARDSDRKHSQRNLAQLEESVSRMKDSLDILRDNLGGLSVTAPIDGLVSDFDIAVGEVIAPGQRIGQVSQTDKFKVRALADEFYLGRLATGLTAEATLGDESVALVVNKIYPNIENRQFQLDLRLTKPIQQTLRMGQNLRAKIELGQAEQVLTIPNGSFIESSGGAWVFVLSADRTTAARREVVTGRRNPESIEIINGLTEGEQVLTSGYDLLSDKTLVKFKNG